VHIGDRELFQKLDAYSAPRLVEYSIPIMPVMMPMAMAENAAAPMMEIVAARDEAKRSGSRFEAEYTVGGIRHRGFYRTSRGAL